MVLSALWGSLGLLLGALGGLLGVSWASLECSWGSRWTGILEQTHLGFIWGTPGGLLGVTLGLLGGFLRVSWHHLWFMSSSKSFFALLRSSWGRFWSLQLTSQPSKIRFLLLSIHSANSTHSLEISRRILLLLLLRGLLLLPLPFESARRNARSD